MTDNEKYIVCIWRMNFFKNSSEVTSAFLYVKSGLTKMTKKL
jgi:hypothetical protein